MSHAVSLRLARGCRMHQELADVAANLLIDTNAFGYEQTIEKARYGVSPSVINWDYILDEVAHKIGGEFKLIPVSKLFFEPLPIKVKRAGKSRIQYMVENPEKFLVHGRGKTTAGYILQTPENEPIVRRYAELNIANINGRVRAYSTRRLEAESNGIQLEDVVFGKTLIAPPTAA